jgi:hypothetical protein
MAETHTQIGPNTNPELERRYAADTRTSFIEKYVTVSVRGNCGLIHTFEEWQRCHACDTPRPLKPWWRD